MSKDDIDKAVKEAEQFAAEDKKHKEQVDIRNSADQMIFQCEKTMGELGDKVSADEKADVEAKINALKEELKGENYDAIKAKQEELQQSFYKISEKVYAAAQQAQQAQAGAQGAPGADPNAAAGGNADYVDADFTEVNDDNK